jgi:hypothetical protein
MSEIVSFLQAFDRRRLKEKMWETAVDHVDGGSDGAAMADALIDDIIKALQKIFPDKSRDELELLVADVRARTVEELGNFTHGLVEARSFVGEFADELIDQAVIEKEETVFRGREKIIQEEGGESA